MRPNSCWLYFVLGLSCIFSGELQAGCTVGTNGYTGACLTEGEAQAYVATPAYQLAACKARLNIGTTSVTSPITYSGTVSQRRADMVCVYTGSSTNSVSFVTATFTNDCSTTAPYYGSTTDPSGAGCVNGCLANMTDGTGGTNAAGQSLVWGKMEFFGSVCAVNVQPAAPSQLTANNNGEIEKCIPQVGLTSCHNVTTGQTCVTSSRGNKYCWSSSETGTRTGVEPSETGIKSPLGTAPGVPDGSTVTASTNLNRTTPNTTTPSSPTTVTNNYSIVTTAEGTAPSACPAGTTGTAGNCVPVGTSTGGENCGSPPVSSGDPLLVQISNQTWATRCAAERANAGVVTGDVANCGSPFTCTGDQIQCAQLKTMRASICPTGVMPSASVIAGVPEGTGVGDEPLIGDVVKDANIDLSALDDTGFGLPRTCPALDWPELTLMGETVDLPWTSVCDALEVLATLILMIGLIHAVYILQNIGQ